MHYQSRHLPDPTGRETRVAGVAFYGLSGSGKSTLARALVEAAREHGLIADVVKLASPLYDLQASVYRRLDIEPPCCQDQELMMALAAHVRRISPSFLIDDFQKRANSNKLDLVVNDDLRDVDTDYWVLKRLKYLFIRVECNPCERYRRLRAAGHISIADESWMLDRWPTIEPDLVLDTSTSPPLQPWAVWDLVNATRSSTS